MIGSLLRAARTIRDRAPARPARSVRSTGTAIPAVVLLALLVLFPVAAAAQETDDAPRFLIESLVVEGLSWSSEETVLSEARLVAGETYDEAELQAALDRINRLPFVLGAEFGLSRGVEPGAYRLTVEITETTHFFISGDQKLVFLEDPFSSPDRLALFEDDFEVTRGIQGGARFFVGAYGELFAALDNGAGLQLGARHYNLFGRGIVGTLVVRRDFACCRSRIFPLALDPSFSWWSLDTDTLALEGRLSVPLGPSHGLFAAVEHLNVADGFRRDAFLPGDRLIFDDTPLYDFEDLRLRRFELGWRADTTDDPLTPLRGSQLAATAELLEVDADLRELGRTPLQPFESSTTRLGISGGHVRPLGLRQALFADARLAVGSSDIEGFLGPEGDGDGSLDSFEAGLRLGHRARLWAPRELTTRPELWVETSLTYDTEETDPGAGANFLERSISKQAAETSLVLRSSWGVLRLSVSYVDWQGYER